MSYCRVVVRRQLSLPFFRRRGRSVLRVPNVGALNDKTGVVGASNMPPDGELETPEWFCCLLGYTCFPWKPYGQILQSIKISMFVESNKLLRRFSPTLCRYPAGRTPPGTPPTMMPVRVVAAHDLSFADPTDEPKKLGFAGGDLHKEVDDFLLSLPFGTSRNDAVIEEAVAARLVSTMSAHADLEERLSGWCAPEVSALFKVGGRDRATYTHRALNACRVSVAGELQDVVIRQSQHIKYLQGQREPATSYSFPLPHAGTQQELSQLRSVLQTIQHDWADVRTEGALRGDNSEVLQHTLHSEVCMAPYAQFSPTLSGRFF
jgi:hypothetical protein